MSHPRLKRERFAELAAAEQLTYSEMAAALQVGRRTLFRWKEKLGLPDRECGKGSPAYSGRRG